MWPALGERDRFDDMPAAFKGTIRPAAMPKLALHETTNTGVEWLQSVPDAPRNKKGNRYLKITGALPSTPKHGPFSPGVPGPFSPRAVLKHTPSNSSGSSAVTRFASRVHKKARSPVFRRTPTGRRRVRKSTETTDGSASSRAPLTDGEAETSSLPTASTSSVPTLADSSDASLLDVSDAASEEEKVNGGKALNSARTRSRLPRTPSGQCVTRGRRLSMNAAKTPKPPSTPFTPAPARPAGEVAIESWLQDIGLSSVDGLLAW